MQLQVKDTGLFAVDDKGGQPVLLGQLKKVQGSTLRYASVSTEQVKKNTLPDSVKPGFYFVRPDNTIVYFTGKDPGESGEGLADYVEVIDQVAQSPDGKVLVFAVSPTAIGTLFFYSWPDMQPMKGASFMYYQTDPNHITRWVNNAEVALEIFDEADDRQCKGDPCGDLSVYLFNPYTGMASPVVYGSDLCDYTIKDVAADRITVGRLCMPTPQAWSHITDDHKPYYETIPLPVRETR